MDASFNEFSTALAQNKTRIHIWRHENNVLTESSDLGSFYTQSIYLVLHVIYHFDTPPSNYIYLWCGAFSNPDDEVYVNERIQVLFNLLKNSASIHHEYEGFECKQFLQIFAPYGGVRHLTPGLEFITNRGFTTLYNFKMTPYPHWNEIAACVSSLKTSDVNIMRTRATCTLWFGFESDYQSRLRAAELTGSFKFAVGRDDVPKIVYQGNDDREFIRALSTSPIDEPKRAEIKPDSPDRREIYQVISNGDQIDFQLVAFKNEATMSLCKNDNAYILRDCDNIYIWFGKNQPMDSMGIGLVIAIVFMQRMTISRNMHIQVVHSGEKFSDKWSV
ncbi:hypothetical protein TVAG_496220 [Trichomonas vaginalis G3]|uniref:Gelsolin-like domain-containing protein n=1 Tax=Trichomonas vaginalis (strain ATCC PRA-98 / G3) TaxID=412133 RepID=A2FR72_TRIV3|nr:actin filament capping [Trichomonas vaginalis G3]EAX92588.1 hypothetical protein TVAG_496220 [Trichomonas vaginalis G3]KAI5533831.1 actin filament capping [Trichomonas vaginalis G3]|eukprot:XP_001305518.1 hypothetical protein [Trichomonas vaginalis G3]